MVALELRAPNEPRPWRIDLPKQRSAKTRPIIQSLRDQLGGGAIGENDQKQRGEDKAARPRGVRLGWRRHRRRLALLETRPAGLMLTGFPTGHSRAAFASKSETAFTSMVSPFKKSSAQLPESFRRPW